MSRRVGLIDPFAGIAGDMFLGALIGAGAPLERVREGLSRLDLQGYEIGCEDVLRAGVAAKKFSVRHAEDHHHRGLTTILGLIERADLPDAVKAASSAAFRRLGEAEAKIHGVDVDTVHFHEVGAVDAICDIVGGALALDALQLDGLYCRPLPLNSGTVHAAHGHMPLPAPATLELMRGRPTRETDFEGELVTPTGAAIVAAWTRPDAPPDFTPEAIGYGAGDRDPEGYANVCRVTVGVA
ncbi:MAG: nickel pincer cofactor biosynthesis protein LarC [Planctomycetota bacterium]|jgi:uncharacterized protein (TIGR00299 family) protein